MTRYPRRILITTTSVLALVFSAQHAAGEAFPGGARATDGATTSSPLYALHDMLHSDLRIVAELPLQTYGPTHRLLVEAQAGDLLRIAGQVEGTEEMRERNKMWAWLSVSPVLNPAQLSRVSSYGWQTVTRDNNHHMPIHLYGSYEVPAHGEYLVEIRARRTFPSPVGVEKAVRDDNGDLCDIALCNCTESGGCADNPAALASDFGQIIVEQYRLYPSLQNAVSSGAKFVGAIDRAPLLTGNLTMNGSIVDLPATQTFNLAPDDILRTQGLATSQYVDGNNLFPVELRLAGDINARLSISTENIVNVLFRFSLQNDGIYRASSQRDIYAYQRTYGLPTTEAEFLVRDADLVAMQFAGNPSGATLKASTMVTTATDLTFDTSDDARQALSYTGVHGVGDILRVHSQLQLQMTTGNVGAACWARITIDVNGVQRYLSVFDQRFIRNSTAPANDHDSGTYSPFALYQTTEPGVHIVRLMTDCSATSSATMFARDYGRHLTVDRFSAALDTDSDGVVNGLDNCTAVANPGQIDADGDSIGNACDADFNNDCVVNTTDLGIVKSVFFTADAEADLNGDGTVNVADLGIMKTLFFAPPGPSDLPDLCD